LILLSLSLQGSIDSLMNDFTYGVYRILNHFKAVTRDG